MRLKISHGRIIDPANNIDKTANLFIDKGRVMAIGRSPKGFKPQKEIDAAGLIVCPGLIDLCARLREPGEEHKATIASETTAAAASGISSICCPPDTVPVIDTPAVAELIFQKSSNSQKSKVFPLGALTHGLNGKTLAEMDALKSAGCIGVSNAYAPIVDTEVLRRALEYAATCEITVHLYCEDDYLRNNGVAHEGPVSTRLGLPAIPETAETVAVSRALLLVEQTGASVHFCRISTARSIELLAEAKARGLVVTADVGIAHLHLTDMDISSFNTDCYVLPPLRSQRDKEGLRTGLANGTITAICSDHQPHESDAKSAPFSMTEPGASTIEMLLPLTLQLVRDKNLTLQQAVAALTSAPAKIAGMDTGNLSIGSRADICIFDPESSWTVERDALLSAGKNTPFASWEMTGKVTHTLVDGNIIYQL
jgi:dihydroorotase